MDPTNIPQSPPSARLFLQEGAQRLMRGRQICGSIEGDFELVAFDTAGSTMVHMGWE
jgi:hypothetical protein